MKPPHSAPDYAPSAGQDGYEITEYLAGEGADAQDLFVHFIESVNKNRIQLPSLPHVAAEVRSHSSRGDLGVQQMARIIGHDSAVSAKLVRTANSPLYRGESLSQSVLDAVSRLGVDKSRQLVMSYTVREVFTTPNKGLANLMQVTWKHSQDIAINAYIISRRCHVLAAEKVLLAGLMHDIGVIPLLAYAEAYPELYRNRPALRRVLNELKSDAGAMLLKRWGFDAELSQVACEVDNWQRAGTAETCDLTDLIQVAHYGARLISDPTAELEPPAALNRIPGLDAAGCIALLDGAQADVQQTQHMLNSG